MPRYNWTLATTLVLMSAAARAQEATPAPTAATVPHYKHHLGFAAGFSTGNGLAYRFTPNRFGVQVAFAPRATENETHISAGLTFLFTLVQAEKASLFLYQGNHVQHRSYDAYHPWFPGESRIEETVSTHGLGVGIEFVIAQRVGFNMMGGYALYDEQRELGFTVESGLFYRF